MVLWEQFLEHALSTVNLMHCELDAQNGDLWKRGLGNMLLSNEHCGWSRRHCASACNRMGSNYGDTACCF